MIYISPKLDEVYQRDDEKFHLSIQINEKKFTKANTPLTYRQINTLAKDRLFPEERSSKKEWRKFSFKELVFFYLIYDLKKYGLSHDFLRKLSDSFFKAPTPNGKKIEVNKYTSEIAILCVLIGAEMMLTINDRGEIVYYDPQHFLLIGRDNSPVIQIRLNDIVNAIKRKNDQKQITIKWGGINYFWNRANIGVSKNEREILNVIRNNDYSAIKVKKTNGQASVILAEKKFNPIQLTKLEIVKLVEAKDFQDIEIVKRNGNIVNLRIEESIKL